MYSPADSRRTPYVGRNHGDDGDDDFDDAANTYDAADDDDDDDDLENKCRGADQDSTLQILLNPNALREIFLRIPLGNIFSNSLQNISLILHLTPKYDIPQNMMLRHRVAELGSLSSGAKMAIKIFVKRVFKIFASNASFLRVIANLQN